MTVVPNTTYGPPFGKGQQWVKPDISVRNYWNITNSRFTSPAISLPAGGTYQLDFYSYLNVYDVGDGGFVEISTDGENYSLLTPVGGYSGTITNFGSGYAGNQGYFTPVFDLSPYAGQTVNLRMIFISDSYPTDPTISSSQTERYYLNEGSGAWAYNNNATGFDDLTINGTATHNPPAVRVSGPNGGSALYFNNDDYGYARIEMPRLVPAGNRPKSLSAWFKSPNLGPMPEAGDNYGLNMIGGFGSPSNGGNFQIGTENGYFKIWGWGSSYDWTTTCPVDLYDDNNWHFIVATYNGHNTFLYVDGSLKSMTSSYTWNTSNYRIVIGNEIDLSGHPFYGAISDFAIHGVSLSSSEVNAMYRRPHQFYKRQSG